MSKTNTLLVRYKGGYKTVEESTAYGTMGYRAEGFLSLADVDDLTTAQNAAQVALLGDLSLGSRTVTADVEPLTAAETPYLGYRIGDDITLPDESGTPTAYRVVSITVDEDDDGVITFTPELESPMAVEVQRVRTWLGRLSSGTLNGRSNLASIATSVSSEIIPGGRQEITTQVFSQQVVEALESPSWQPARRSRFTFVDITLLVPGSTATVIEVRKNGVALTWNQNGTDTTQFLVPAGVYHVIGILNDQDIVVEELDRITMAVTTAGTGAEQLSVNCFFAVDPAASQYGEGGT